tara:strand:+ start:81262 stop:82992 length:1731 start_codon:yes stop_codon:yes gene_type:complete
MHSTDILDPLKFLNVRIRWKVLKLQVIFQFLFKIMDSNKITIGLVQSNPIVGDISGNKELAISFIERLSMDHNPDLIVFSEMFLTGYPPEDLLLRNELHDQIESSLQEILKVNKNCRVVIGYPKKRGNNIYNAAGVLHGLEVKTEYFKQELPNYDVFDEKRYFLQGKGPGIFEVNGVRIALTVCEDIWHTKAIRQASRRNAQLVINLNASPFHIGKFKERENLLLKHSNKFKLPILYVNQVGGQDELVFDGSSVLVQPDVGITHQLKSFSEDSKVIKFKKKEGRIYTNSEPLERKESSLEDIYNALVLGTKDYIDKNGFPGVIIGSSGGIDSALTAVIAADALGKDKVRTFMMPFKYTSEHSIKDSKELSRNLGLEHKVIEIGSVYEAFNESLNLEFRGKQKDKTEENLQSRCRGVILMAISNKSGELVLTTGNKSETAVGYSTLYGDTAGGFAVLKDVPKTLVYDLANYRNSISGVIPERIITRAPTAELAPNQLDTDSLPSYSDLDQIIELYVEKDLSKKEIVQKGFQKKDVDKVIALINLSEYKRRQAPIGIKITKRNFGKDRRYPITNRYSQ